MISIATLFLPVIVFLVVNIQCLNFHINLFFPIACEISTRKKKFNIYLTLGGLTVASAFGFWNVSRTNFGSFRRDSYIVAHTASLFFSQSFHEFQHIGYFVSFRFFYSIKTEGLVISSNILFFLVLRGFFSLYIIFPELFFRIFSNICR